MHASGYIWDYNQIAKYSPTPIIVKILGYSIRTLTVNLIQLSKYLPCSGSLKLLQLLAMEITQGTQVKSTFSQLF